MEPNEGLVFCEQATPHYLVLAVGAGVKFVGVGDTAVFDKSAILLTLTPKRPRVLVREADILAKIPAVQDAPPAP